MSESEDSTPRPLHLAPSTWMRQTGIRLGDALGWEGWAALEVAEKDQQEPITREEFIQRAQLSDVLRWPDPPFDERPEPPDEFVSRLAEALKSEFGAQFGIGINADDEVWKRVADGIARKMRCEYGGTTPDEDTNVIGFYFNRRVSE